MSSDQSAANETAPEEEAVSNQPNSDTDKTGSSDAPVVVPETAATESETPPVANESKTAEEEVESPSTEAEKPKRRVQLNPSADPNQFKAIPSQSGIKPSPTQPVTTVESKPATTVEQPASSVPPEDITPTGSSEPAAPEKPVAEDPSATTPAPPPAPVEIPTAGNELDAALEAEIDAALSNDQKAAEAVVEQAVVPETAEEDKPSEEELEEGTKLTGKIDSIHGDNVFIDLGYRSPV